jgi:hypothetical protein
MLVEGLQSNADGRPHFHYATEIVGGLPWVQSASQASWLHHQPDDASNQADHKNRHQQRNYDPDHNARQSAQLLGHRLVHNVVLASGPQLLIYPSRIASFLPFPKREGDMNYQQQESGAGLAFFVFLMGFGLLMVWLIM